MKTWKVNFCILNDFLQDGDAGNEVNASFVCTIQCPQEFPHRIVTDDTEPYCAKNAFPSPYPEYVEIVN